MTCLELLLESTHVVIAFVSSSLNLPSQTVFAALIVPAGSVTVTCCKLNTLRHELSIVDLVGVTRILVAVVVDAAGSHVN